MKSKIALFLALISAIGFVGCNNKEEGKSASEQMGNLDNAVVWGVSSTEKVLQNVHGIYESVQTSPEINIYSAKGEYEAQQIIITADNSKKLAYTLELSDLKNSSDSIFSKENIEVFHEKYLVVTSDFDKTGNPVGNYPDALVPYENIVAVGENVVEPNQNQGLYFKFNVPVEQAAGVYTGSAKLTIGDKSMQIPITLTVRNLVVSQENHARSLFLTSWFKDRGELDTTQEMQNKYNEFLYKYRLSGSELIIDTAHTSDEIEYYVDIAYEHMQNPLCNTVGIPGKPAWDVGFEAACLKAYFRAFAKKSFETNYNMMEKLVFYDNYIDEVQFWGPTAGLNAAKTTCTRYMECIQEVCEMLEQDDSITSPIKDEVIESLRKVPMIMTAHYEEAYAPYIDTWCPQWQYYDTEFSRSQYDDQEEKWWYGCCDPRVPYATYHMEDTLLSARLEPWMMVDYDVKGSLYWGTDIYAKYTNADGYSDIDDYYTGVANRISSCNGDGFLLYPGKAYGVDGPIGSMRLESIRDGREEYEILYELKKDYESISEEISKIDDTLAFSIDKVLSSITASIYEGTRITGNNDTFAAARASLYDLAELGQNAGVCITDFKDNTFGEYEFTLIAPNDVQIKQNNSIVSAVSSIGEYKKYVLTVNLTGEANYFGITAEVDGITYGYSQHLSGQAITNKADNVSLNEFGKAGVTPSCSIVDANTLDTSLSGKMVKVVAPAVGKGKEQSFTIQGSLLNGVGSDGQKAYFHVYYTGTDNVKFIISAKYKNMMVYYDIANVILKPGLNTIEIPLSDKDWATYGGIDFVTAYLGELNGEPERTIYILDSVAYKQ